MENCSSERIISISGTSQASSMNFDSRTEKDKPVPKFKKKKNSAAIYMMLTDIAGNC